MRQTHAGDVAGKQSQMLWWQVCDSTRQKDDFTFGKLSSQ